MNPKHTNPFTATLGATPPLLVGRSDAIRDFGFALDEGPGAHERISLIIGPRGIGKTALLNAFEDEALTRGWLTLSDTATTGFVERLRSDIIQRLSRDRKQLKGLNVSILGVGGGLNWDTRAIAESTYSLRNALKDLLAYKRELDRKSRQEPGGVLVTLDEMHHQRSQELIEFGATIQHLVREGEDISVVMAGIPSSIRPLLSGKLNSSGDVNPVTFLRRANSIELGRVSDSDVREALEEPLHSANTSWSQDALETAVEACHGYPFMIQLVGQCSFRKRSVLLTVSPKSQSTLPSGESQQHSASSDNLFMSPHSQISPPSIEASWSTWPKMMAPPKYRTSRPALIKLILT